MNTWMGNRLSVVGSLPRAAKGICSSPKVRFQLLCPPPHFAAWCYSTKTGSMNFTGHLQQGKGGEETGRKELLCVACSWLCCIYTPVVSD